MKKLFVLALAVVLVVSMASIALAIVAGSAHDLRGDAGGTPAGTGEICVVCHTPHNAMVGPDTPNLLWNHELSTATYTMYSSGTMDTPSTPGSPNGISKLCLGCHDGTVAIDNYGGTTGPGTLIQVGYSADVQIDPDMSDTHPISIEWPAAADDLELADPASPIIQMGISGNIVDVLEDLDGDGVGETLQCSACHDVHNTEIDLGATYLLRVNNNASGLCVKCHLK